MTSRPNFINTNCEKDDGSQGLKGHYVALLVQSLPHCTTSTTSLLRLNSLIQQTDTRYFSSDTGQMEKKKVDKSNHFKTVTVPGFCQLVCFCSLYACVKSLKEIAGIERSIEFMDT